MNDIVSATLIAPLSSCGIKEMWQFTVCWSLCVSEFESLRCLLFDCIVCKSFWPHFWWQVLIFCFWNYDTKFCMFCFLKPGSFKHSWCFFSFWSSPSFLLWGVQACSWSLLIFLFQLIDITGKNQDECVIALHDCNGDVNRAINVLLEGNPDTVECR